MPAILVGIDGSDGSRVALRWAHRLSVQLGWRLRALQAWRYEWDVMLRPGPVALPSPEQADRATEEQLALFVEKELGAAAQDVAVRAGRGPAAGALLRAADLADLLVVGARGLGGFEALLLGSVSRQVVEHASCPVVIVPGDDPDALPATGPVLVGYDGSIGAATALTWAARLASRLHVEVIVAHAMPRDGGLPGEPGPDADAARHRLGERARTALGEAGVPTRTVLRTGDPRTVLLELAEEEDAGLLVVGTRGRGPIVSLLLGSVAASVCQHSTRPVAVVPPVGISVA